MDEVIQFDSVASFSSRPNFVAQLQIAPGELDRIVGKYELSADKANWATCGLNQCNTEHRFGYVISAKDGQETNIGKDCGKREFDVEFEEVEARYKKAVDAQAQIRTVKNLLLERVEILSRIDKLLPEAQRESVHFSTFRSTFQSHSSFWSQLQKCAKLGGVVRAAAKQDKDWSSPGAGREQLITVSTFEGHAVLLDDGTNLHWTLARTVKPWFEKLSEDVLIALEPNSLDSTLRDAAAMKRLVDKTEKFVVQAQKFLAPSNIARLEPICTYLLRRADIGETRKALEKWVADAESPKAMTPPRKKR